jgi:hypothetical protein
MKIAYYTSGVPGSGRIVQGISLCNALKRAGITNTFVIISSSKYAHIADIFGIPHVEIPRESKEELSPGEHEHSVLYNTLLEYAPNVLIVDRMWFTLYHFIEKLPCKKIFFSIQVDDRFFSMYLPDGLLNFDPKQYDRIIAIEPFDSTISFEQVNPLIIRNRDEILPRSRALEGLGVDGSKKVCVVALNYKKGYFEKLVKKYSYLADAGYDMVYTTNLKGGGIFPIVDYFNAVDLVVCAAGYTQFWETVYFEKDAVFEFLPLHFSDMKRRFIECSEFTFKENGADQMVKIITSL